MPDLDLDPERRRAAPAQAIILVQIDGLVGQFLQIEGPEQARDGEEDLALGDLHAGADAAAIRRKKRVSVRPSWDFEIWWSGGFENGEG